MQYMLMDYVQEQGWQQLSGEEQERWLGAYRAYMEAMQKAGVLRTSGGLKPPSTATTVRVADGKLRCSTALTLTPKNSSAAST